MELFHVDGLRAARDDAFALPHEDAHFVVEPRAHRNARGAVREADAPRERDRRAPGRADEQRRVVVEGVPGEDEPAAVARDEELDGLRRGAVLDADRPAERAERNVVEPFGREVRALVARGDVAEAEAFARGGRAAARPGRAAVGRGEDAALAASSPREVGGFAACKSPFGL